MTKSTLLHDPFVQRLWHNIEYKDAISKCHHEAQKRVIASLTSCLAFASLFAPLLGLRLLVWHKLYWEKRQAKLLLQ